VADLRADFASLRLFVKDGLENLYDRYAILQQDLRGLHREMADMRNEMADLRKEMAKLTAGIAELNVAWKETNLRIVDLREDTRASGRLTGVTAIWV
jgi:chromosome segregation ATPase